MAYWHRGDQKMIPKYTIAFIVVISAIVLFSILGNNPPDGNYLTGYQTVPSIVEIVTVQSYECNFTLSEGWNLVSFFCLGMLNNRGRVMQSINGNYSMIFRYDAFDSDDPWKSYNPNLPSWTIQQVPYMDRLSGYYIYMIENSSFYYNGTKKYTYIPLKSGWNLIGYPRVINSSINDAFSNISYNKIKTLDEATGDYIFYTVNGSSNTLTIAQPYEAYWINSTASQTWIITAE